ncbi:TOMM precursor leader peptide-binding protein [Actinomycetospora termitidis]|uniref:TOMM leader peptide-binding protein n=1 Tax=Actinomycetospora termitidis TaxID=3053470 RepID=A0ABT7MCY2_9PSEU|nr:TOMM precursor leader peptide-binding protein [Actinomycetospora sp. Odt1-22]MDL5157243.1 TOMM precursor leader peptide-binding protein [Actinomycetospora sp. Odt1-22]
MTTSPVPHLTTAPRWRDATTAQFGDHLDAPVLEGLDPPLRVLLAALRSSPDGAVATAVARGARPEDVREVLAELGAARLLRPPGERTVRQAYVRVHGAGRTGVAIATVLAASGVGRVAVRASGPVGPGDPGTGLDHGEVGHPAVLAAAAAVARAAPGVAVAEPTRRRPDLVVLTGAAVADRAVTAPLQARHQPHLAVTVHDPVGVVGPLVVPGRTSCLRCADRHREDADPARGDLDAQRADLATSVPVALATVVAGLVVGQVLEYLAGRPALREAVEEVDPTRGTWVRRACPPHPSCPCTGAPPRAPAARAGENRGRVR